MNKARENFLYSKVSLGLLTCFFICISYISVIPAMASGASPPVLTLKYAIKTALKTSPLIRAKKQEVISSTKAKRAAKGSLFPKINSYADYTRLSDAAAVVPISSLGGPPPTFSRDQYKAGITVSMPLYEGGRLWSGLKLAKQQVAMSKQVLISTRQNIIAQVTNTFNSILYLKALLAAQKETLLALETEQKDAELRLKLGKIAPLDLMEITTQVSSQNIGIEKTKEELIKARQRLCYLMGWNPIQPIRLKGRLSPGQIQIPSKSDIYSLILRRPDIIRAQKSVSSARTAIKIAEAQNMPSVNLVGDYGRRAGWGLNSDQEVWSAGIQVSLNIFNGGITSAKIAQAEAKLAAAQEMLTDLTNQAKTQVLDAICELRQAESRISLAQQVQATAQEAFRIQKMRYERGAGTVTDMLKAQASWMQAKAELTRAIFDHASAVVALKLYTGTIGYTEVNKP